MSGTVRRAPHGVSRTVASAVGAPWGDGGGLAQTGRTWYTLEEGPEGTTVAVKQNVSGSVVVLVVFVVLVLAYFIVRNVLGF